MKPTRQPPQKPSTPPRLSRWFALPMADSPRIEPRLRSILAAPSRRLRGPKRAHVAAAVTALAVTLPTLAALHVIGKEPRQGNGAASAAPPASTPAKSATFAETLPPQKRWTRVVPGTGVSVELLGVSLSQKPPTPPINPAAPVRVTPSRWNLVSSWSPDGTPYSRLLYPSTESFYGGLLASVNDKPEQRAIELAVRIHNESKQDIGLWCLVPRVLAVLHTASQGRPNNRGNTLWRIALGDNMEQKRLHVQLRLAAGDYLWHQDKAITADAPAPQMLNDVKIDGQTTDITYSTSLRDKQGRYGFVVSYSGLRSYNTRVVAIDTQGQEIKETQSTSTGTSTFTQVNLFFDPKQVPQSRIAKIRLEARPYQKIVFDDIALYPEVAGK